MNPLVLASAAAAFVASAALWAAPARPRIFLTPADLPALRARADQTAANRLGFSFHEDWLKLKERANHFLNSPPYHYVANIPSRDGKTRKKWEYTLSDAPPPRHDDSRHYPPWTGMFQERADSITTRIKHLSFAFLMTGDRRYFERAKRIVMHLCAWPGVWTDPTYSSGRPCLDTGHAAEWVGVFYDWCYDALTPQERRRIRAALVEKALAPIDGMMDSISPYANYTAIIATGLGVGSIALLGEEPRAQGWIDHAAARIRLNLDAQGKDGGPMEGPMYGSYAANSFTDLIWALHTAGLRNDLAAHHYIKTLPRYCVSLLSLNTRQLPTFGDGGMSPAFVNLMLILALRGDADAAWYCQQVRALEPNTVRKFLALDPDRIRPRRPTFNPSAAFVDVGYAVLRDGYSVDSPYLAFKCGPPQAVIGHNHYDHNSFVISYAGVWTAWDPGYRNYFFAPARKYTVSTFGHNSVVLDLDDAFLKDDKDHSLGRTQVRLNHARIAAFFTGRAFDYARGCAADAYNTDQTRVLDQFDREIIYAKPKAFFILDTLRSRQPHTFSFMLHAPPGAFFEIREDETRLLTAGGYLQVFLRAPGALSQTTGLYPGAEAYGPYFAATTPRAAETRFVAALVPRANDRLLINPGFEHGLTGWTIRNMPGWAENHHTDTQVKHGGKASARIDGPGGYLYSPRFRVTPGVKLSARWWAKCAAQKGASSIFYFWRNGKSFARELGPRAEGDAWRQYAFSAVAPAGTEEACLALQFFGKGRCWYDDVELSAESLPEQRQPAAAEPAADAGGWTVRVDGETYVLLVGPQTTVIDGRRIQTDAALAAVHLNAAPPSAFLPRGGTLTIDGKPVASTPGEWRVKP